MAMKSDPLFVTWIVFTRAAKMPVLMHRTAWETEAAEENRQGVSVDEVYDSRGNVDEDGKTENLIACSGLRDL